MEDFQGILTLVVMAIVMIVMKLQKKSAEKTATSEKKVEKSPWLDFFPEVDIEQIPEEEAIRKTVEQPKVINEIDSYNDVSLSYIPNNVNRTIKDVQPVIEHDNMVLDNRIIEEFDLRQAVIYSEILKPKFDE